MKFKSFVGSAMVAGVLLAAPLSAFAVESLAVAVQGYSFSDRVITSFSITTESNVVGQLESAPSFSWGPGLPSSTLDNVTFSSSFLYYFLPVDPRAPTFPAPPAPMPLMVFDQDASGSGFSFKNLAAGNYILYASGNLDGSGDLSGLALLRANYNIAAVPEPESYAMLLAGLGLMGGIARRRKQK